MTAMLPDDADAWATAWKTELADRPAFAEAADGFTATFRFRITPDDRYDGERIDVRFDLEDGDCTALHPANENGDEEQPYDYLLQAPYTAWKALLQDELDLTDAVMGGPFGVEGDTMTLLQRQDAIAELVAAAREIETSFSC